MSLRWILFFIIPQKNEKPVKLTPPLWTPGLWRSWRGRWREKWAWVRSWMTWARPCSTDRFRASGANWHRPHSRVWPTGCCTSSRDTTSTWNGSVPLYPLKKPPEKTPWTQNNPPPPDAFYPSFEKNDLFSLTAPTPFTRVLKKPSFVPTHVLC